MAEPAAELAKTLLVVDDNDDNLEVLARRLERKGYKVLRASGGKQALLILGNSEVDLVVLDVMMPEVTGLDVLRELRKTRSSAELPVIMATAQSDADDVVTALDLGANDHVAKPIDFDVLHARIRAQLRGSLRAGPMSSSLPPGAGQGFEAKYELQGKLGTGGFGSVYRAKHRALDTFVAIKVLHTHLLDSSAMRQRFAIEGISTCRVRHPNAVAVLDAGTTDQGAPYLVMELLEGKSLQDEISQSGVLTVRRTAEVVIPVCEVLQAAHEAGVIHRDIKPGNIMLVQSAHGSRGEVVKVLDFGIAKLMDDVIDRALTGRDQIVGTPYYMAPERLLARDCDGRSDVYSLGAMMYQMLSARFAFGYANTPLSQALRQLQGAVGLERVRPGLPRSVVNIVMRCLATDPERRPPLTEVADTLRQAAIEHFEAVWPPVLIDIEPQGEEVGDTPSASGYAKTVALLRDAADKLGQPSAAAAASHANAPAPETRNEVAPNREPQD